MASGRIYEINTSTTSNAELLTKGYIGLVKGRTYRVSAEVMSNALTAPVANLVTATLVGLDEQFAVVPIDAVVVGLSTAKGPTASLSVIDGWVRVVADITIKDSNVASYARACLRVAPNSVASSVMVADLKLEDVSSVVLAETAAAASVFASQQANTAVDSASQQANAAALSATLANTARSDAGAFSQTAANAANSANAASSSANSAQGVASSASLTARKAASVTRPSTFEDGTAYWSFGAAVVGSTTSEVNADAGATVYYNNNTGGYLNVNGLPTATTAPGRKWKIRARVQSSTTGGSVLLRLFTFDKQDRSGGSVGTADRGVNLSSTSWVWIEEVLTSPAAGVWVTVNAYPNFPSYNGTSGRTPSIVKIAALEMIDVTSEEASGASASAAATSASQASSNATTAGQQANAAQQWATFAATNSSQAGTYSNTAAGAANSATQSSGWASQNAATAVRASYEAAQHALGNLIDKPSFEDNSVGSWTGATTIADAGPTGLNRGFVMRTLTVDITNGPRVAGNWASRKIRCQGWVKNPNGVTGIGVGVIGARTSGASWNVQAQPTTTADWTQFDLTVTTASDAVTGVPFVRSNSPYGVLWSELVWTDITESSAAAGSASAAKTSSELAAANVTAAAGYASLASNSAALASVYMGQSNSNAAQAGTYANSASNASVDANRSAGWSASNAALSLARANTAATSAAAAQLSSTYSAANASASASNAITAKQSADYASANSASASGFASQALTAKNDAVSNAATATQQAGISVSASTAAQKAAAITRPSTFEDGSLYWNYGASFAGVTKLEFDASAGATVAYCSATNGYLNVTSRVTTTNTPGRKWRVRARVKSSNAGGHIMLRLAGYENQDQTGAAPQFYDVGMPAPTTWEWVEAVLIAPAGAWLSCHAYPNYPSYASVGGSTPSIVKIAALEMIDVTSEEAASGSASAASTSASIASANASAAGTSANNANRDASYAAANSSLAAGYSSTAKSASDSANSASATANSASGIAVTAKNAAGRAAAAMMPATMVQASFTNDAYNVSNPAPLQDNEFVNNIIVKDTTFTSGYAFGVWFVATVPYVAGKTYRLSMTGKWTVGSATPAGIWYCDIFNAAGALVYETVIGAQTSFAKNVAKTHTIEHLIDGNVAGGATIRFAYLTLRNPSSLGDTVAGRQEISSLYVEDISAQVSASAARTSSESASAFSNTAGTHASTASQNADWAKANSSLAAGYSNTAKSASDTANSASATATSASGTAVSALNAAAKAAGQTWPSDFELNSTFWGQGAATQESLTVWPENAFLPTPDGRVLQSVSHSWVMPQTPIKPVAGRRYRVTVRLRCVSNPTNGGGTRVALDWYALNGSWAETASGATSIAPPAGFVSALASMPAGGWQTLSSEIVMGANPPAYLRPRCYWNWNGGTGTNGNSLVHVLSFVMEDVTDSVSSALSAAASQQQASYSAANAGAASSQANTATQERISAETANTNAKSNASISITHAAYSSSNASAAAGSASSAAGSASGAATSAILAASVGNSMINANPLFTDYPVANQAPTGWTAEVTSGANITRQINPMGGYQMRLWASANQNMWLATVTPVNTVKFNEWYVIEADVQLNGGRLAGAAVLFRPTNTDVSLYEEHKIVLRDEPDTTDTVPGDGVVGRIYRWRKLVRCNYKEANRAMIYAMSHYDPVGPIGVQANLSWQRCGVRPASAAEIEAQKASAGLSELKAAVEVSSGVLAELQGKTEAYWTVKTNAGSGSDAFITAQAESTSAELAPVTFSPLFPARVQITLRNFVKTSPDSFDASIFCEQAYAGRAYVSAQANRAGNSAMFGLCENRAGNYTTLRYGIFFKSDNSIGMFIGDTGGGRFESNAGLPNDVVFYKPSDTYSIQYDNNVVTFRKNGSIFKAFTTDAGRTFTAGWMGQYAGDGLHNMNFAPAGPSVASTVSMGAREIHLLNYTNGDWKKALSVVGGNAEFSGGLKAGTFIRLGSGAGWDVALASRDFTVSDGTAVDFGLNMGSAPDVKFSTAGLAPLNAGETYKLYAESLTATGFVARMKILTPGTSTAYQATNSTAPGSGPTRQMDISAQPSATNGFYSITFGGSTSMNYTSGGEFDLP